MPEGKKIKVLLVDDELDARECFKNFLKRRFEVHILDADNGETAINLARSFSPDIIFLDIHMPKLDGWDVIREVRKFNPDVKIIVITGWETLTEAQRDLVKADVACYLKKPLSFEQVTLKMFEVLGPDFKQEDPLAVGDYFKGRLEARQIVHALANIHGKIRVKAEAFVSNYEDGFMKDRSDAVLVQDSMVILKDIIIAVDEANLKAEEIRNL